MLLVDSFAIEDFEGYNGPPTGHAVLWLEQEAVIRGLIRCETGALEKRLPRSGRGSHTALKLASALRRLEPSDHVCVPFEERLICVREVCAELNVALPSDETVEAALQRLSATTWGIRKIGDEFHIEPESLDLLHLTITESEGGFRAW